jgi:hypothetical protein
MLAEFDPLGNKKVEGPTSLNLDIKFTRVIFTGPRQDDKGALLERMLGSPPVIPLGTRQMNYGPLEKLDQASLGPG